MSKSLRAGLLSLSLLTLGGPTHVSAAQTTTATETTANEDSETDRGWVGLLPPLGAAAFTAIAIVASFCGGDGNSGRLKPA